MIRLGACWPSHLPYMACWAAAISTYGRLPIAPAPTSSTLHASSRVRPARSAAFWSTASLSKHLQGSRRAQVDDRVENDTRWQGNGELKCFACRNAVRVMQS